MAIDTEPRTSTGRERKVLRVLLYGFLFGTWGLLGVDGPKDMSQGEKYVAFGVALAGLATSAGRPGTPT